MVVQNGSLRRHYCAIGFLIFFIALMFASKHSRFMQLRTSFNIPRRILKRDSLQNLRIQKICHAQKLNTTASKHLCCMPSKFYNKWTIDKRMKLFYSIMPKVGSNSILGLIATLKGWETSRRGTKFMMRPRGINNMTETDFASYFKFTFVRHPWMRIVSAFKDKFINQAERGLFNRSLIVTKYGDTFADYIQYHIDTFFASPDGILNFNAHVRPQYYVGNFCCFQYDFVGRLENFTHDVQIILKILNIKKAINALLLPNLQNCSKDKTKNCYSSQEQKMQDYRDLFATLSSKQLQQLKKIYQNDFHMFNYSYDI